LDRCATGCCFPSSATVMWAVDTQEITTHIKSALNIACYYKIRTCHLNNHAKGKIIFKNNSFWSQEQWISENYINKVKYIIFYTIENIIL